MSTGEEPAETQGLLTTVGWEIDGQVSYAVEGSAFAGGAVIQWLRDGLGIIDEAGETEALARSVESNDGVYFVPALAGLGAPYWDSEARGTIVGLTRGTAPAHIARAALESIAYRSRDMVEVVARETGSQPQKLLVDGGASRNHWLMQFQADILGVPVERPKIIETTAMGAAGLAGLQAGVWETPEDFLAHREVDRQFEPTITADRRENLYQRWKQSVERSREWAES
jgi:glycerol kinase